MAIATDAAAIRRAGVRRVVAVGDFCSGLHTPARATRTPRTRVAAPAVDA
jgi:hypothetical protein